MGINYWIAWVTKKKKTGSDDVLALDVSAVQKTYWGNLELLQRQYHLCLFWQWLNQRSPILLITRRCESFQVILKLFVVWSLLMMGSTVSSVIGEKCIVVWRIDGIEIKQSASCVLSYFWMEHPVVFLDSRCIDNGDADKSGLHVLATSEIGVCYFWYAKNMEDLYDIKT